MITLRAPLQALVLPDLRLAPSALAAWSVALVVLRSDLRAGAVVLVGVAVGLGVACALVTCTPGRRHWLAPLAAVLVAVLGVGGVALLRSATVLPAPVRDHLEHRASAHVELVVTSDPMPLRGGFGGDRVRVAARLERLESGRGAARVRAPVTVFGPTSWARLLPGTRVAARARFGSSDRLGEAALLVVRGPPEVLRTTGRVQRAAGAVRAGLHGSVDGFSADAAALVPAMVLGDTSRVSPALRDAARTSGLTHLTAVSGANVAILLAAVLGAARLLGLRRRGLLVLGLLAVLGFVLVARPEPSVLRAAVMGSITLIGVMRGITGRGPQVLAAGVLLLLAVDPWLAVSAGFALSVVATAALLLVAPWWRDRLSRWMPMRLAEPLAVASVAHLATAPIVVVLSGHVSLVAVVANLAVEPAVVVVTVCGAIAAVIAPFAPGLADWSAWPAGLGAWWVAQVAHRAAALPWAEIGWPGGAPGVVALLLVAVTVLLGGPVLLGALAPPATVPSVGGPWHASRDVHVSAAAPGHPRGGSGGPAGRARRRPGRHRRPRGRRRGRRP